VLLRTAYTTLCRFILWVLETSSMTLTCGSAAELEAGDGLQP
jgi:hypothetical protein